ncbi:MAG: hypothetical protein PVH79_03900 [Candidatus Bathyarchaeota archaeon]|jgi:hypothetical protein
MRIKKAVSVPIVLFTMLLSTAGYAESVVNASSYRAEAPPGISGAEFPDVVSYFDRRGILWVFWIEDSIVYYTNLTDTSRWDITTSDKDYLGSTALDPGDTSQISINRMHLVIALGILVSLGAAIELLRKIRKIPFQ